VRAHGLLDGLPTFLPGTRPRQINLQKLLRLHSTCLTTLRSQVAVSSPVIPCSYPSLQRMPPYQFEVCSVPPTCQSLHLLELMPSSQLNMELQQQLAAIPGFAFSDDELYVLSRQLEPVPATTS
jgi:hypothetical protein